jgi:hypothetical protein
MWVRCFPGGGIGLSRAGVAACRAASGGAAQGGWGEDTGYGVDLQQITETMDPLEPFSRMRKALQIVGEGQENA